ncbi:hypothetical protein ACFFX0_32685 [Citricoccus parietis]|uniref:Uncharacterized protein n=1 Tax=Citricoccus parietis TaxID=592307 RepID=A0ABV5G9Q0_9MICC
MALAIREARWSIRDPFLRPRRSTTRNEAATTSNMATPAANTMSCQIPTGVSPVAWDMRTSKGPPVAPIVGSIQAPKTQRARAPMTRMSRPAASTQPVSEEAGWVRLPGRGSASITAPCPSRGWCWCCRSPDRSTVRAAVPRLPCPS